jgi:hypothetical protein
MAPKSKIPLRVSHAMVVGKSVASACVFRGFYRVARDGVTEIPSRSPYLMKLDIRTPFPCRAEDYWAITGDPAFMALADQHAEIRRDRVEARELPDGRRFQRMRYTSLRPLPPVASRVLGVSHLVYEQEETLDDARLSLDWTVRSPIGGDRFDARGIYHVLPAVPGCERLVRGEIRVTIPLVGGQIEKQIVTEIQRSYDRSAEVMRRWLVGERRL